MAWDISKALRAPVLAIVAGLRRRRCAAAGVGRLVRFLACTMRCRPSRTCRTRLLMTPELPASGAIWWLRCPTPGISTARRFFAPVGAPPTCCTLMGEIEVGCVVGYSKRRALDRQRALRLLPAGNTEGLRIVTLGCPIAGEPGAAIISISAAFSTRSARPAVGVACLIPGPATDHSANTSLPLSMDAGELAAAGLGYEIGRGSLRPPIEIPELVGDRREDSRYRHRRWRTRCARRSRRPSPRRRRHHRLSAARPEGPTSLCLAALASAFHGLHVRGHRVDHRIELAESPVGDQDGAVASAFQVWQRRHARRRAAPTTATSNTWPTAAGSVVTRSGASRRCRRSSAARSPDQARCAPWRRPR